MQHSVAVENTSRTGTGVPITLAGRLSGAAADLKATTSAAEASLDEGINGAAVPAVWGCTRVPAT